MLKIPQFEPGLIVTAKPPAKPLAKPLSQFLIKVAMMVEAEMDVVVVKVEGVVKVEVAVKAVLA